MDADRAEKPLVDGPSRLPPPHRRPADRLAQSRTLFRIGILFPALLLATITLDGLLRPPILNREAEHLVRILDLDALSLVPAGRPLRHALAPEPGLDDRFGPRLPAAGRGPASFLIQPPPAAR